MAEAMRWSWWMAVCAAVVVEAHPPAPVVDTAQGQLRGKLLHTYTGQRILSFIGVRYAEPPTGRNRFKPPVPLRPWEGVRNVTEDSPLCTQIVEPGLAVSEDCLFLNVYTKSLTGRKAVITYMHPGGFAAGTGNSVWMGPQYLMDKDIVLVTFNYRLGPFGFLSTGDQVLRGNYGLKDQLAVLRWVNQNIARFGGDPQSVTLFGYSAGAASVQMHMVSPQSRGLFHKAISGSCSFSTPAVLVRDPLSLARRFAKLLNCSTESSQQIRECLMNIPENDLLQATTQIQDGLLPPFSLFAPVVEKGRAADAFLLEEPEALIRRGEFSQVPLMTGITKDEFNWRAETVLSNESTVERLNQKFDSLGPWEFQYPRTPVDLSKRIGAAFRKFYFHNQPVSNATEKELGELFADSLIIFSVDQAARLIAEKSAAPVFFYLFSFEGRYSFRYKHGTKIPYGVGHHDDLIYLLYFSPLFPLINETDPEAYMVRTLTSIYSSFANTGRPTVPDSHTRWTPITTANPKHLEINRNPSMKAGLPYPDRMTLWESQLPLDGPYRQIFY